MSLYKSTVSETTEYDPRYDRAQTIGGAKSRYISHDQEYTLSDLERDIGRILTEGENPDKTVEDELYDVALLGSTKVRP